MFTNTYEGDQSFWDKYTSNDMMYTCHHGLSTRFNRVCYGFFSYCWRKMFIPYLIAWHNGYIAADIFVRDTYVVISYPLKRRKDWCYWNIFYRDILGIKLYKLSLANQYLPPISYGHTQWIGSFCILAISTAFFKESVFKSDASKGQIFEGV